MTLFFYVFMDFFGGKGFMGIKAVYQTLKQILKITVAALILFNLGCEEAAETDRDFSQQELQLMSKQWCAETRVDYGTEYNSDVRNTLVKLDLTSPGTVYIDTVTLEGSAGSQIRRTDVVNCDRADMENVLNCYGIGAIAFQLQGDVLTLPIIEEVKRYKECVSGELNLF